MKLEGKKQIVMIIFVFVILLCGIGVWAYRTFGDNAGKCATQGAKTIKNIDDCLKILAPSKDSTGTLEWLTLNDSADVTKLDSYSIQSADTVSPASLKKILNNKFYSESDSVMVLGLFIPNTRLTFVPQKGGSVCIVYSFANSQFRLYRNEKPIKEGLIHNGEELQSLFQAL